MQYVIILIIALIYAVGALFLKRATASGFGITRIMFITNWLRLFLIAPLLLGQFEVLDWSRWWAPLFGSLGIFIGLLFVLVAIRTGDVSIQTPLMGTKVLMVAAFSLFLLGGVVPLSWWIGAIVCSLAVFILGVPGLRGSQVSWKSVFCALLSCACFAFTDVMTSREASIFGEVPFLLLMFSFVALESLFLIPFFRKHPTQVDSSVWKWALLGALLLSVEESAYLFVLGYYGEPTLMNVLYSSRGIWSIAVVWYVGHWFANEERKNSGHLMAWRLLGSVLLCSAIAIVLVW